MSTVDLSKIVELRDQAVKQRDQMVANANALAGAVDAYNLLINTKDEPPVPPAKKSK